MRPPVPVALASSPLCDPDPTHPDGALPSPDRPGQNAVSAPADLPRPVGATQPHQPPARPDAFLVGGGRAARRPTRLPRDAPQSSLPSDQAEPTRLPRRQPRRRPGQGAQDGAEDGPARPRGCRLHRHRCRDDGRGARRRARKGPRRRPVRVRCPSVAFLRPGLDARSTRRLTCAHAALPTQTIPPPLSGTA